VRISANVIEALKQRAKSEGKHLSTLVEAILASYLGVEPEDNPDAKLLKQVIDIQNRLKEIEKRLAELEQRIEKLEKQRQGLVRYR